MIELVETQIYFIFEFAPAVEYQYPSKELEEALILFPAESCIQQCVSRSMYCVVCVTWYVMGNVRHAAFEIIQVPFMASVL